MLKTLGLKVVAGKRAGTIIEIPPTGAIIGRQPPAEILVDEAAISRQHCSIYVHRNRWFVEDLGSQNGTFLNGSRITKEFLRPGDKIQVGSTILRVPRNVLSMVLVGLATAAVAVILVLAWGWASNRRTSTPPTAPTTKSEPAKTRTPDDVTDEDVHPGLKRPSH
jgi:pSer/pThr/pTyr-binding forkhead associated (FHA) protein